MGIVSRLLDRLRPPYEILPLKQEDTEDDLQCREGALSAFFKQDAWDCEKVGLARTFVLRMRGYPRIAGYYSLMMGRITASDVPAEKRLATNILQLPVAVLGKVARDHRVPKSFEAGRLLVLDALARAREASKDVGCVGVMLDAKNDGLVTYYRDRYGFEAAGKRRLPQKMYLSMADLAASMDSAQVD